MSLLQARTRIGWEAGPGRAPHATQLAPPVHLPTFFFLLRPVPERQTKSHPSQGESESSNARRRIYGRALINLVNQQQQSKAHTHPASPTKAAVKKKKRGRGATRRYSTSVSTLLHRLADLTDTHKARNCQSIQGDKSWSQCYC